MKKMKLIKIAFIGTHGVGKTTLMYQLAGKLKMKGADSDALHEIARNCPFAVNKETTKNGQRWILFTQITKELDWLASKYNEKGRGIKTLICDRSVLDNYAYYVNAAGRDPVIEPLVREWVDSYDYLIYVPPQSNGKIEEDGFRDTTLAFQMKIDSLILKMCKEFGVKPVMLNPAKKDRWLPDLTRLCRKIVGTK